MSTIPTGQKNITFEELVNRIKNEELIEQITHVLEVHETNVELAHRQQMIQILYKAACNAITLCEGKEKEIERLKELIFNMHSFYKTGEFTAEQIAGQWQDFKKLHNL